MNIDTQKVVDKYKVDINQIKNDGFDLIVFRCQNCADDLNEYNPYVYEDGTEVPLEKIKVIVVDNIDDCENEENNLNKNPDGVVPIDLTSNILTEGGIYPVPLVGGADDAFLKIINEILGGEITEVNKLELVPALGFGGSGRYWYKAHITLDEMTILNFISEESTPEAKRLLDNDTLIINPYSDISIDCSANSAGYIDGTTLDALNDSDANMKILNNESDIIGNAIITKLIEAEDKIIEVLKQYEDSDDDDYIDESLIPIKEWHDEDEWDDDELASIYGGDTRDSQKNVETDYKESYLWYGTYVSVSPKNRSIKKIMFEFNSEDYDEAFTTFENIIPEPYSSCKLLGKVIYGIASYKQLQKDGFEMIKNNPELEETIIPIEEASNPRLGKKIKQLKGWKIYQGTNNNGEEIFRCFTPDEDRPAIGYEDWECETLEQAISWIENYDLEESLINIDNINIDEIEISSEQNLSDLEEENIIIERVTSTNIEQDVFMYLENIEILASSYEELDADSLMKLIDRLDDEMRNLKDVYMQLRTGIKHIQL